MTTAYSNIFKRFLRKITDYDLSVLIDADLDTYMIGIMESAIPKFLYCQQDLSLKDDTTMNFTNTLTLTEEEILSGLMLIEWSNPYIYTQQLLKEKFGTRDYNLAASPANHLDKLIKLKNETQNEVRELMVYYYNLDDWGGS